MQLRVYADIYISKTVKKIASILPAARVFHQQLKQTHFMKTGNVNQVASFEQLLGFCHAHGAGYNPSKLSITLAALDNLHTSARHSMEAVRIAHTEFNNSVNLRQEIFSKLPVFTTRIANALAATEASKLTVQEAYAYVKKFRWQIPAPASASAEGASSQQEVANTRSVSQRDFNSRVELFEGLLKVVSMEPTYMPNETDLTVPALQAKVAELRALNSTVMEKKVALSNAKATRDRVLYSNEGILHAAKAVKRYMKGAFGYSSVAYNQIKGLRFINKKAA